MNVVDMIAFLPTSLLKRLTEVANFHSTAVIRNFSFLQIQALNFSFLFYHLFHCFKVISSHFTYSSHNYYNFLIVRDIPECPCSLFYRPPYTVGGDWKRHLHAEGVPKESSGLRISSTPRLQETCKCRIFCL